MCLCIYQLKDTGYLQFRVIRSELLCKFLLLSASVTLSLCPCLLYVCVCVFLSPMCMCVMYAHKCSGTHSRACGEQSMTSSVSSIVCLFFALRQALSLTRTAVFQSDLLTGRELSRSACLCPQCWAYRNGVGYST